MDDVNIGLFERDWNTTIYYFILNSDEQIYMRYGGRDSRSPDSYLDLSSLELALRKGLELHGHYLRGDLPKIPPPARRYPREIPLLVERTFARGACVECHLIGDFTNLTKEQEGKLDKLSDLYRSPDLLTLGIRLDVPKGLAVKESQGAAAAGGLKPGDIIRDLNGTTVWTFGDLQYRLDKVPRSAREVRIGVDRDGSRKDITISLPERWWWTDLTFRQSSVEPRVYFDSRPLSAEEKSSLGLPAGGFASEVVHVDSLAEMLHSHELKPRDIICGVDGVQRDDQANIAELYIKLRKTAGDTVTLDIIRDGRRLQMKLVTYRLSFRK